MNNIRFIINGNQASKRAMLYIGFFLLITGLLIFSYPRIFAFLIAGIFCLLGIVVIIYAFSMRTYDSHNQQTEDTDYEEMSNH